MSDLTREELTLAIEAAIHMLHGVTSGEIVMLSKRGDTELLTQRLDALIDRMTGIRQDTYYDDVTDNG